MIRSFCRLRDRFFRTMAFIAAGAAAYAEPAAFTTGNVRVQLLSDSLVRIEAKGPAGFEDRPTFHVVNRDWPGTAFTAQTNAGIIELRTANYVVRIPLNAASFDGVSVNSPAGEKLYGYDGRLENSQWLPSPGEKIPAWWFADAPRLVPPAWGLTPPPAPTADGGWDLKNDAPDMYVF